MKKINHFIIALAVVGSVISSCKKGGGDDTTTDNTPKGKDSTVLLTDFDYKGSIAQCYKFGSQTNSDSARNPAVSAPIAHTGTGFWRIAGTCAPNDYYLDGFGGTKGAGSPLGLDMNDSVAFWVNTQANANSYISLQIIDKETKPAATVGTTSCPAIDGEGLVFKIVLPATNGWVRKSVAISQLVSDKYQITGENKTTFDCWGQLDHVFTPSIDACEKFGFTVGDAGAGLPVDVSVDDIAIIKVP